VVLLTNAIIATPKVVNFFDPDTFTHSRFWQCSATDTAASSPMSVEQPEKSSTRMLLPEKVDARALISGVPNFLHRLISMFQFIK
jgi:hypothetical protein